MKLNFESFDELLCCEICTEPYAEPSANMKRIAKQLNCGHTYCLLCLEQMFDFTRSNTNIVCPTCRAITIISGGKKGIINLKNNFTILDLLETINSVKKNENEGNIK
jgi:ribosomal protein S27E